MGSLTYVDPDLVIKTEEDAMKEDHEMMDLEEDLRLDTLPAETLLHVLEYLDVKFITEILSQVCFCYSPALDWSILPYSNDLDQSQDIN